MAQYIEARKFIIIGTPDRNSFYNTFKDSKIDLDIPDIPVNEQMWELHYKPGCNSVPISFTIPCPHCEENIIHNRFEILDIR